MWSDRIVDDGRDRSSWERSRLAVIGASDVKAYARASSATKYLAAKLRAPSFTGNAHTARGHEWEPVLVDASGVPASSVLIHSPDETRFAATPDGVEFDGSRLAEVKLRHARIAAGPSRGEWRQLAWQLMCVPEADGVRFVEGELLEAPTGWYLRRDPIVLDIARDDPRITEALATVLPIARDVLTLLREYEQLEGRRT